MIDRLALIIADDSLSYSPNSLVEDRLKVALSESRALEVLVGMDLLGNNKSLIV